MSTQKEPSEKAIAPPRSERKMVHCSFCGKSQDQVRRLIAAGVASICGECVGECVDILNDTEGTTGEDWRKSKQ